MCYNEINKDQTLEKSNFYKYLKQQNKLPKSQSTTDASGSDHNKVKAKLFGSKSINTHRINLNRVKLKSKIKHPPTKDTRLKPWFLDFKFLATSCLIFLATQVFLNFGAYKDFLYIKYLQVFDIENNLQTTAFKARQTPNLNTFVELNTTQKQIPLYDFEVMPTDFRILIPNLNINVPIKEVPKNNLFLQDWTNLEKDIQRSLQDGVIHYPGTPTPDLSGNVVITGHSSYYPWSIGRYKDVFAVLHNTKVGDLLYVYHKQRKYVYQIATIDSVYPKDIEVLADNGDNRLTLITCTPLGTNIKRLIVTAVPIEQIK